MCGCKSVGDNVQPNSFKIIDANLFSSSFMNFLIKSS